MKVVRSQHALSSTGDHEAQNVIQNEADFKKQNINVTIITLANWFDDMRMTSRGKMII